MPKGKYLFDASKPNLEDFYEDMCSYLPKDILQEFAATMATQHSNFELQFLSEMHTEMGKVIKAYAMWPLIQKDFGKRALTVYDNLIQQDNHKDLSLSKFYQICIKLKEEVEQLRGFINSREMKFVTALADWPVQSAAELSDLDNFFDKTIKKHYQAIIAYLAQPGLQDFYGRTPLTLASRKGHFATVKALLAEPGIDVNKADNGGSTPLIWAAYKGHLETVRVLLDQPSIDVNKADNDDRTPLIMAAAYGDFDIVKTLLAWPNIDVNKADNNGNTPLHWATHNGHLKIVKALLAQPGIDVNKADNNGNTSLSCAELRGYEEIALFIKNHIASTSNNVTGSLATLCYAALLNQGAASNGAVSRSQQNNCCII